MAGYVGLAVAIGWLQWCVVSCGDGGSLCRLLACIVLVVACVSWLVRSWPVVVVVVVGCGGKGRLMSSHNSDRRYTCLRTCDEQLCS